MNQYKCLNTNYVKKGDYSLVPVRNEDRYEILVWRNSQIDILRQKTVIEKEQQDIYFENVVAALFKKEKPEQILWSFFLNDKLIGYGGLVHIDWDAKHAEISFLLCNERNSNIDMFKTDWKMFLQMVIEIAFNDLKFNKIHTFAYDIREHYFEVMYELGFKLDARLKDHVMVKNKVVDVLILSKFCAQ